MRTQRLTLQQPDAVQSVARVVKELCGLQAQEARAATLAVRPRSVGLLATDIEHARVQERSSNTHMGSTGYVAPAGDRRPRLASIAPRPHFCRREPDTKSGTWARRRDLQPRNPSHAQRAR